MTSQENPKFPPLDHSHKPGESLKDRIKRLAAEAGLPPPPWTLVDDDDEEEDADDESDESLDEETDGPAAEDAAQSEPGKETDAEYEARLTAWEATWRAEADRHDGLIPFRDDFRLTGRAHHPRIPEPSRETPEKYVSPPPPQDDAETELTALISECRFFMREISFHSARLAAKIDERALFVDNACRLAEAGAAIGKTVAKLRSAGNGNVTERHQRITVEHVERTARADAARKA